MGGQLISRRFQTFMQRLEVLIKGLGALDEGGLNRRRAAFQPLAYPVDALVSGFDEGVKLLVGLFVVGFDVGVRSLSEQRGVMRTGGLHRRLYGVNSLVNLLVDLRDGFHSLVAHIAECLQVPAQFVNLVLVDLQHLLELGQGSRDVLRFLGDLADGGFDGGDRLHLCAYWTICSSSCR